MCNAHNEQFYVKIYKRCARPRSFAFLTVWCVCMKRADNVRNVCNENELRAPQKRVIKNRKQQKHQK